MFRCAIVKDLDFIFLSKTLEANPSAILYDEDSGGIV